MRGYVYRPGRRRAGSIVLALGAALTFALGWASAGAAKPAAAHAHRPAVSHAQVNVSSKPAHTLAHAAGHKIA